MPRYIDADLIDYNEICVPMLDGMIVRTKKLDGLYAQQKYIEKIPTADVQEVKHGRWAHLGEDEWYCTCCGFVITTEGSWEEPAEKYCSNCGAKMNGGESE